MLTDLRRLFTLESLLLFGLLAIAGAAAESLALGTGHASLVMLALGAGLVGVVLGARRFPDALAHLIAIAAGLVWAIASSATLLTPVDATASFTQRMLRLGRDLRDWYIGGSPRTDIEGLLVSLLLHLIVWLVAYLAAWSLARQGWLTVTLALPAVLVIAAVLQGEGRGLLQIYVVLAIVLMARVTLVRRQRARRRSEVRSESRWSAAGTTFTALVVALLVTTIGTMTPPGFSADTFGPVASHAGQTVADVQEQAGEWIGQRVDLGGGMAPEEAPRYSEFADAFSVGGDLDLSENPEVLVRTANRAPYLTAQSYDMYNGRGWESTVSETFRSESPDGTRYAPELAFRADQEVPYTDAVGSGRVESAMEVTSLTPDTQVLFSDGVFLSSDERASVRMFWLQMDGMAFPLRDMNLADVPRDLVGLASALIQADDLSFASDGLLLPQDADARERVLRERDRLAERFIDVAWEVAEDGRVLGMTASGQVPIYDGAVRVSRSDDAVGEGTYGVTSFVSTASDVDLRGAGDSYPDWVDEHYLDLPDGVTQRTVDLALQQTFGATTDFDRARAIETFLRGHIAYDLEAGETPDGEDVVDWVLFEDRYGFCEHYASAMAVMLRAVGIPSRVVVGYFPGDYDAEMGGYLYRQGNAHAWTEAYFPGFGWIPFEPTSAQPPSTREGIDEASPSPTPEPTPQPTAVSTASPESDAATPPPAATPDDDALPPIEVEEGSDGFPWVPVAVAAAIAVLALGGVALFLSTRAAPVEADGLFAALLRWGRAGGVRADAVTTPREYAGRIGRRYPDAAADALDVVDSYESWRYGDRAPSASRLAQSAEALRNLRRQVVRSKIWPRR